MSGYMVAWECEGRRQVYMVREPDPEKACEQVKGVMGHHAYALAPIADETLDHFRVTPGILSHLHTHMCNSVVCCGGMHDDASGEAEPAA